MRFGQTFRNLRRDFNRLSHWQQAGVKQLAQRFPLYHFHRNVVSGTVLSEFVDGNDIRMVEGRRRACFLLETVQPVTISGECGGQNLDRNAAVKARIPSPVHLAHPAGAEQLDNLVRSELRAGGEGHSARHYIPKEGPCRRCRLFRRASPFWTAEGGCR